MMGDMRRVPNIGSCGAPSTCAINHGQGPGIDTELDYWPERGTHPIRVLFGDDAVGEMAALIGWAPPDRVADLEATVAEQADRITELEAQVEAYKQLDAALAAVKKKPVKKAAVKKAAA